jgi:hypothetical protein
MDSDEESRVNSEQAMDKAKSHMAATSVKGSIYQKSSKKNRLAESENGFSSTIKGTP